jgi:glycosyltransferase involved in cell wall biosynthesis
VNSAKPLISIITIVRNAPDELSKTINSVLGQNYPNIEFIVIDGASTDGTPTVIIAHSEQITYWVSEPDRGIYDAMNKGLAKATGEWVNFMNAGDLFLNANVISKIFEQELQDTGIVYGDSIAQYPGFKALRKALPVEEIWKGMVCCHQSMFFRTSLVKPLRYNPLQYFSADYELIFRLFSAGRKFRYLPVTVAVFDTRGLSNRNMVQSARSNLDVLYTYRTPSAKERRFHRRFIFQSKVTELLYRCLPSMVISILLKWLYRNEILHESSQP